jgi:tripartite-type tricarboxylate transporter receptor subunit TctC
MKRLKSIAVLVCTALFALGSAGAQEVPGRLIHLVVPSPPAGGIDPVARVLAKFLENELKTTVVVENKPGAQTLIGSIYAARAKPDGATLLVAASISTYPVFYKDPGVDVLTDLEFISPLMRAPQIVAITANAPYRTYADLAAISKANPDKLNFTTYGDLLGLYTSIIAEAAGIKATEIKFSNPQDAAKAVAFGDAAFMLASVPTLRPWQGKISMLSVTTNERSPLLPDVPSLAEAGVKTDGLTVWMGLFAPRGTPRPIIDRLNAVAHKFVDDPEAASFLKGFGFQPYWTSPEQFRKEFSQEQERLTAIAKKMGITPQ